MTSVLLVDDDPIILRIYRDGLTRQGFQIQTAGDGLGAIKALQAGKPDLLVLDLMIPMFTGADVVRFVRAQPGLKSLPIIVLSNSYMDEMGRDVAASGVDQALLKVRCTPVRLGQVIAEVLAGREKKIEDASQLLAVQESEPLQPRLLPPADAAAKGPLLNAASRLVTVPGPETLAVSAEGAEAQTKARAEFLKNAPAISRGVGELLESVARAAHEAELSLRLQDLYRRVHFVTAMAALADTPAIGHMTSAFEALLFELIGRPKRINSSVLSTIASTGEFLMELIRRARQISFPGPLQRQVLVVDDDPVSCKLVSLAVAQAQLESRTASGALAALELARAHEFHLFLLDIEMPEIDGFELCKQLRLVPEYRATPIIFVTSRSDAASRQRSAASGGNDLITKPILPVELAAKSMMHLLQHQLPQNPV